MKTIRVPESKLSGLLLAPGDILFNEGGDIDKLGRGWVWEGQINRCSFQNHVFRARLFDKSNQPKYISWWGNFRGLDFFLRSGKQTTNLASINKSMLSNLPISLPLPEEQAEIVRRVETLFAFADRLAARYAAARAQVEKLTPSLLAKAFRGELVPQDPNDEPASELLARIHTQRNAHPASPPKRGRGKKAATP
jgi:type I restriction enzyme S subunit